MLRMPCKLAHMYVNPFNQVHYTMHSCVNDVKFFALGVTEVLKTTAHIHLFQL